MVMSTYHPFQKLCYPNPSGDKSLLLAATGPYILSLDLQNGGVLSKWPADTQGLEESSNTNMNNSHADDESPNKRRKISPSEEVDEQHSRESSVSIEFVSERAKDQRRKKKKIVKSTLPNVSQIISTADGAHVIAVTAEDKCIRVCMPKRLCAVALTNSQDTILAGDKFGDIYALPLHPSSDSKAIRPAKPQVEALRPFKPSASELTVHTKGNREALRQQKLYKAAAPKKQEPTFEHQLILGHVSTLTDLVMGLDPSNDIREYIVSADRDEHIRVSRGIPQAHIICNYCLRHTDFVSRLCMLAEQPQFLISGGGEPSLRIFDWLAGTIVAEIDFEESIDQFVNNSLFRDLPESSGKRAVSCIRALHIGGSDDREEVFLVVVALEGMPGIFTYLFYPDNRLLIPDKQYHLPANVLDIVILRDCMTMLISLDNVHAPMSTKRPNPESLLPKIHVLDIRIDRPGREWQYSLIEAKSLPEGEGSVEPGSSADVASKLGCTLQSEEVRHEIESGETVKPSALYSPLGDFLYGLENLRKKIHGEGAGLQTEDGAGIINVEDV